MLVHYFEPSSVTCLLEPWLRELGFSIFYGSILIKLYRILTEFQTRKAHRVCFSDKDQIIYLLAIVLIVVGYMSAWTALMVDGFFFGRQVASTSKADDSTIEPAATNSFHSLGSFNNNDSISNNVFAIEKDPEAQPSSSEQMMLRHKEPRLLSSSMLNHKSHHYSDQDDDDGRLVGETHAIASFALLNYSIGNGLEVGQRLASAVDQLAQLAPEHLKNFARNFNSFADIFSGLVETQAHHDTTTDSLTYSMRCRKLTWDYVTELSK